MLRALTVCALLLALPLLSRADDKPEPTETVLRLTVHPAPVPKPALRYQLLPELAEMNPGNAPQAYLMCFMEQHNFFFNKDAVEKREKWATMPLKDLPLKELREQGYGKGTLPLRQADHAARLDRADWQVLLRIKEERYRLLLPELQQMRTLAAALKVRFRLEIAERRFDDALGTAKTLFALGRHLGEHSTVIAGLVGMAVAYQAIDPLDEMLQQPGCPNLFWALTDLPHPLIDLRKGAQCERMFLADIFAAFDERVPMSEAQLKGAVERIRELLKELNGLPWLKEDVGKWLAAQAGNEPRVAAARKRLVEGGLPEDTVKQFPALQTILLDEKLVYEIYRDDGLKVMSLPYWQAERLLSKRTPAKGTEESLFIGMAPGVGKMLQVQARLEQRLALLCCVESLRQYAAENGGKFPARLDDVKLPLSNDPITGKPFVYKLDGATAVLQGTPPSGMEKSAAYNVRYEVSIGK